MATRRLDKADWAAFFDGVSRALGATQVEIEVASLALGDQVQAEWVNLSGMTYDSKAATVELMSDTMDHRIQRPIEVYAYETRDGLDSIEVVTEDGTKQIIKLRRPLLLAAPAA